VLEANITLRSLWQKGRLNNAAKYVDKLLDNFSAMKKKFGECEVRIGLLGDGHSPNYYFRVLQNHESSGKQIEEMLIGGGIKEADIMGALADAQSRIFFGGRSHKRIEEKAVHEENWSEPPMTFNELAFLLNDIKLSDTKTLRPLARR